MAALCIRYSVGGMLASKKVIWLLILKGIFNAILIALAMMLLIFLNIGIQDLGMISMPYSRVGMIDALTNVSAVSESMPHLTPESFLRILILLLVFLVI